jgi:hypothetical protein
MQSDNTNNRNEHSIPENDPSKAMDSKREVENANDPKIEQDFPGYPHYPAREDIMDQRNDVSREEIDVENLPNSRNTTGVNQRFLAGQNTDRAEGAMIPGPATDDDLELRPGTEADVTSDDLAILNATDGEIGRPQNVSNEELENDLDIPGSELDDANEEIGEEDEENNYYSLGGDRHEHQEEDPTSGPNRDNF